MKTKMTTERRRKKFPNLCKMRFATRNNTEIETEQEFFLVIEFRLKLNQKKNKAKESDFIFISRV